MEPLNPRSFADIVGGDLHAPRGQLHAVEHVSIHSGRIRSGSAFFALAGTSTDGHRFVDQAAQNGAVLAVVKRGSERSDIPTVAVDDPLQALQALATWWRSRLAGRVVAVVGSNGKTITKDALVHLLGYSTSVYGTPGSYNSQLGVPLAVLDCPRGADVAIIEVAVSDPGEMATHAGILRPDHVVVTNVGSRWRNRFDDRAHQIRELLTMASSIPDAGWLLLGEDEPDLVGAAAAVGTVHVQHRSAGLPEFAVSSHGARGARLEVRFPSGQHGVATVNTPSAEILADLQLAVSAAHLLAGEPDDTIEALQEYTPTATRIEMWRSPSGVTLVRDVATPDPIAVGSAIRTAKRLTRRDGRTVVVLAEPTPVWSEAAVGLAQMLDAEGVDEVCAVHAGPHRRTADALVELGSTTTMTLFGDGRELRTHLVESLAAGDVCLVQSPPGRPIADLASLVIESMAPTRLYIDLSAVEDNLTTFRRLLGPSVKIAAMVKALAYGTDAAAISSMLQEAGVDFLGVSGADEGVALRRAGVGLPILVLLGTGNDLEKMLRARLTPLVYSPDMFEAVSALARRRTVSMAVHVEVDTGFHRSGLDPDEAIDVSRKLASLPGVTVEGLMTHLACADDPNEDGFTDLQLDRFDVAAAEARALGFEPLRHAAATAAAIRVPRARLDMVRIGLGLYGLHPSPATASEVELAPAISLVSRLVQVIDVPAGERVGYGGTYTAPSGGGRVGVVPAGYHDCVPRAFSNHGYVVIQGVRCPIIGRVSMDSMTVDVSECPSAAVGSDVLIYGRLGDWSVPLEEVAAAIDTIAYEVMARVGPRVQRIFTRH